MTVALAVGKTQSHDIAACCTGGIVSNGGETEVCGEKVCAIPIAILCIMKLRWTSVGLNLCHQAAKPTGNCVGYGNSDVQFIPETVQNVT